MKRRIASCDLGIGGQGVGAVFALLLLIKNKSAYWPISAIFSGIDRPAPVTGRRPVVAVGTVRGCEPS